MSGDARFLGLLCCAAIACAAPTKSEVARPMASAPEPVPVTPGARTTPAPDTPAAPLQSIRIVAVTDAPDFSLRPRMEGDDLVVVPLPPERRHLVSVEVGLLVTRRDTGEIMDQQAQTFSWKTRGAALRFYLPALPGGDYVAELRATSTVMTASGETVQALDKSQVSFRSRAALPSVPVAPSSPSGGQAHASRSREVKYHFKLQHAPEDTPALIQDEAADLRTGMMQLKTILRNNDIIKVTLDCWASSDGDTRVNMGISSARCTWVDKYILQPALGSGTSPPIIAASHGEDNPPVPEPAGSPQEELQKIQQQNRVVILKIYTLD